MKIKKLLKKTNTGEEVRVNGWVKNRRGSKNVFFISLNDGSTIENIQVVCENNLIDEEVIKRITTGACICVSGVIQASKGADQEIEILASLVDILGDSDAKKYQLIGLICFIRGFTNKQQNAMMNHKIIALP